MKHTFLLTLIFCNIYSGAQTKSKAWLAEKYVTAVSTNDTAAYKYLIPIEGFEFVNNTWYILTYRGEINPFKKTRIKNGRYKIHNLHTYINLMENDSITVSHLKESEVYLNLNGDKLVLEFVRGNKHERIIFASNHSNYKFQDIRVSKAYLAEKYNYQGLY